MFISNDDLKYNLYPELIQAIARNSIDAVNNAIITAQSILEAHLCNKYDTDILFAQSGAARNPMLVNIAANITLYILANVLDRTPETILEAYDYSMSELVKLNKGLTSIPGAPVPINSDGTPNTFVKSGSIDRLW